MIVETETAIYELDNGYLRRFPRTEPLNLPEYADLLPAAVAALRKDTDAIPYTLLEPLEIGKSARFEVIVREDGTPTHRTTTNVISIR